MSTKPSVLIFSKRGDRGAETASQKLSTSLVARGYAVFDATHTDGRITKESVADVKLGVVIGGDGTFLTLVRSLEKKELFPIMGVNLGSLGFITEFGRDEIVTAVGEALAGRYPEETRQLMQVEICRGNLCRVSGLVFNDAVISKDARTSMLKFDVSIGGEFLSYVRADGYIVATPTGSTAYNLSAGGPLMHPAVAGLVLVPICPHSLSARPIIVPQQMTVEIVPRAFSGLVYLVLDGQINHEIDQQDQIKVRMAGPSLRLIRSPRQNWSQTLRSKLEMG